MFSTVMKVWEMLKPFHKAFKLFVVIMVIYEGLQILETYTLGAVLNLHSQNVSWQTWLGFLAIMLIYDELFMRLDNKIDERIIRIHTDQTYQYLKNSAMKKFFELTLGWHQEKNSAVLVEKVNRGVDKVHELITTMSWEFIPGLIQLCLTIIPLLFISPWLALVLLVALGIFMTITFKGYETLKPLRESRHDMQEEEAKLFVANVRAIQTVRFSGQEDGFVGGFENIHNDIIKSASKEVKIVIYKVFRNRIRVLTLTRRLIMVILVTQLLSGGINIALLVYANTLAEKLITSFWRFARVFDQASKASESANRLYELLNEKPDMEDNGYITATDKPLDIEFDSVSFGYESNLIVEKLSFKIPQGLFVAIVGPSGAGKSTVFSLLLRDRDIQNGIICIGGYPLQDWNLKSFRDQVAVVPQQVDIFDTTVWENLVLLNPDLTQQEVEEACKKAYIHDRIMEFPAGYQTKVGEDGQRLSGGERQRLAIARALLKKSAKIFLFDEPTSALDSESESKVEEAMKSIQGKTRIVIAHRLATVKHADLILVLDKGQVVEQGTHSELLSKNGLYASLASRQNLE